MDSFTGRRTWLEIDLDALIANYHECLRLTTPGAKVTCVLKANAYGNGAIEVARALSREGADSFAVSCVREGIELRRGGVVGEILVMGASLDFEMAEALSNGLTLTVSTEKQGEWVNKAAETLLIKASIQVKVETGMHRLGFPPTETGIDAISRVAAMPHVDIGGLYSHLALVDKNHDEAQHRRLLWVRQELEARNIDTGELHLCDSIGMVRYPAWHYDRVRVGAMLYGVRPSGSWDMDFACRETLTFKTRVTQVNAVAQGEYVGYDDNHPMVRDSKVAVLCAGYGDGYPRRLPRGAAVLIRGRFAPVIGIVCMDQLMVDATDIPDAAEGDEATLLGGGVSYMQFAKWADSNRNELIARISRRPVRVYFRRGEPLRIIDDLLEGR